MTNWQGIQKFLAFFLLYSKIILIFAPVFASEAEKQMERDANLWKGVI